MIGMRIDLYQIIDKGKEKPTHEQARSIATELSMGINDLFPNGYIRYYTDELYCKDNVRKLNNRLTLKKLLNSLSDKEVMIIEKRIAGHSLSEVGDMRGTNKERIRQIEAKAHEKIRQKLENENW